MDIFAGSATTITVFDRNSQHSHPSSSSRLSLNIIIISLIVVVVESKNDLVLKPLLRNNNDSVAKRLCALEVELPSLMSCIV